MVNARGGYRICGDAINNGYTYRQAGVDVDAGNSLVERIKPLAAATRRPGVVGELGGFAGLFDLAAAGYTDPFLVAATDGVGTKLKIAIEADRHDTIGIDLVAMCVNDLAAQGAEPLFFLDYLASGKLDQRVAEAVVAGVARGCEIAGCALIGGETAEMPGMYAPGDYDLAGFAVGAVERGGQLDGADVEPGDVLLGLASSGVHANGFSLVRRLIADMEFDYRAPAPFDTGRDLAQALLEPTRIYAKSTLSAVRAGKIKALAHITGGGLIDNLPRVLPDGAAAEVDVTAWRLPPAFQWLARIGGLASGELARTFNCGIGMVAIAAASEAAAAQALLAEAGETVFPIGHVVPGERGVRLIGAEAAWPS